MIVFRGTPVVWNYARTMHFSSHSEASPEFCVQSWLSAAIVAAPEGKQQTIKRIVNVLTMQTFFNFYFVFLLSYNFTYNT